MERPKPSSIAWGALAAGVVTFDLLAPEGETLSEAVDRGLEGKYKPLVVGVVGLTALHLLNLLTPDKDPIHLTATKARSYLHENR